MIDVSDDGENVPEDLQLDEAFDRFQNPGENIDLIDEYQIVDKTFLSDCHELIAEIYSIWLTWGDAGKLPSRSDFDPIDLVKFLPNVCLVDVDYQNRDFIYRLLGTAAVEFRRSDPTGLSVKDNFIGESYERAWKSYCIVVDRRSFLYDFSTSLSPSGFSITDETIFLPLSNDGERVDMIFVFSTGFNHRSKKLNPLT